MVCSHVTVGVNKIIEKVPCQFNIFMGQTDHLAYQAFSWWGDVLFGLTVCLFIYLLVHLTHKTCCALGPIDTGMVHTQTLPPLCFGPCACVMQWLTLWLSVSVFYGHTSLKNIFKKYAPESPGCCK